MRCGIDHDANKMPRSMQVVQEAMMVLGYSAERMQDVLKKGAENFSKFTGIVPRTNISMTVSCD